MWKDWQEASAVVFRRRGVEAPDEEAEGMVNVYSPMATVGEQDMPPSLLGVDGENGWGTEE